MKKNLITTLVVSLATFVTINSANASLITIGTAAYGGSEYQLIYDVEDQITWLDYSNSGSTYSGSIAWASSLNAALTINLNEGYSADWSGTSWRLPNVYGSGNNYVNGIITGSEMADLYYSELGNELNDTSLNFGNFTNINSTTYDWYYLTPEPNWAWDPSVGSFAPFFSWGDSAHLAGIGDHLIYTNSLNSGVYGMAVISGEVSAVPIPAAVWLFGSGLIGLVGFARRKKA